MKRRLLVVAALTVAVAAGGAATAYAAGVGFENRSGPVTGLEKHVYGPNSRGASYVCVRFAVDDGPNEVCTGWNPAGIPGHRSETEAWATLFATPIVQQQLAAVLLATPVDNDG